MTTAKPILRSLRVALLLLVLAAVVPSFALVIYMGLTQRQRELTAAADNAHRLASLTASRHEQLVEAAHQLLTGLANLPSLRTGDQRQCAELLASLHSQYPTYASLGVAQPSGEPYCSAPPLTPPANFKNLPWFDNVLRSRNFVIGGSQIGTNAGQHTVHFAYPVLNQQRTVQAVVYATLDLDWLNTFTAKTPLPPGTTLTIVDRHGNILVRLPDPANWLGKSIARQPLFRQVVGHTAAEAVDLDNTTRIYAVTPVSATAASPDLFVLAGISKTAVLRSANQVFRTYLLLLAGFAVITLLIIWLVSNWAVLSRVQQMMEATRRLGAGDLEARTGLTHDSSELGQLARAFDDMAASLQRKDLEYEQAVVAERQVESALRESEEMFRSLSASSPLGIFMTDTTGHCTYANPRFRSITHLSFPEIAGNSWLQVIHPADRHRVQEEWDLCTRTDRSFLAKARLATGPKAERWILARAARMQTASNTLTGFVGTLEDITEHELAGQEIVNWKRRYELIAAASSQVVYDYDLDTDAIAWSGSIELVLGYQLREMTGGLAQWLALIHPDDRDGAHQLLDQARDQGTAFDVEYRFQHRTGDYVHIHDRGFFIPNVTGKAVHMIGMMEDISARKRAEEALRNSERRFRDLFENSPDAVFVESQTGLVLDVNPAGCRLHNLTREQIIGSNVLDLIPADQRAAVAADFAKWFTDKQTYYDGFTHTGDGRRLPVEIRGTPIDYQGTSAVLLHVRDITERKRAEEALLDSNRRLQTALEQLERTQQQMLQQERLRALGQMASGIAHDFNNALTSILGFSELLLHRPDNLANPEKTRRYLQLINTAATDAGHIVSRLREFYRPREAGEVFALVDLSQVIQQAVSLTQPRWKTQAEAKGLNIQVRTDLPKVPLVPGNATELREALTNLILNSVDAMPTGGTITIRTQADDRFIIITVADTGTGMTEEVRKRCLDPFFSTKGAAGTGLGLSMVFGIFQRHGGAIAIASQPGHGTTCTLRLPRQEQPAQPTPPTANAAPLPPQRVLVVDDEPTVRAVLRAFLAHDGHHVEVATHGTEALRKFQAGQFDLAILDRAMPGKSGDQVAAALKKLAPQLPIIMLTGFGTLMNEVGEKPPGVDLVVSKPVTMENLRAALAQVCARPAQA